MNKILTFLFLIIFATNSFGQEYKKWMKSSDVKVEDIIAAAEAYLADNPSRKERKIFERWKYNALRQQDENGYLRKREDEIKELKKFIQEKETLAMQRTNTSSWSELGPTDWNATAGYTPGVGRITSFAEHPTDPNTFIIGAVSGGIWKTTNGGTSWTSLLDNYTNMVVLSLAIDPSSPSTYYWGTNDGKVFKSTDAGATWNAIGTTDDYGDVNKIIVNPDDSDIVIVSSEEEDAGIYFSDDGGANFSLQIDNNDEPTGYDVEFKPGNPDVVYATGHNFHKSVDGGYNWTKITGFDFTNQPKMIGVSPDDPNKVYVIEANGDGFNAIYVSNNSGDSFTKLTHTLNYFGYDKDGMDIGDGQAPRDMGIAVSPTDADEVHIAGINTWRSTDGGNNFTLTSHWSYPTTAEGYCHADVDDLLFKGSTLVALTDGGIYYANNSTAAPSTSFYSDQSAGLGIHQFYKIGVSQTSTAIITGGSQDNGNSVYNGTNWKNWLGADGMESFVDKNNTNILYGEQQYGGLFTSTDGGLTNEALTHPPGQNGMGEDIKGEWVTPFEQDPTAANTLYAGYKHVYKSTDSGDTWTTISQDFGVNLNNLKIAPSNNNIMFASQEGNLYKTTTGGGTWSTLSGFSGNVNYIAIHPTDEDKIAIATTSADKVYVSDDGGSTWTVKNSGLPNFSALCLVWQNTANNCLYLGMNYGVFYINDTQTNWTNYSNLLPNVIVSELEINNAEGKIYAGTYGRGLWKSDLHAPTILPIELGDFNARIENKKVRLSWFTLSEENNDYFLIQKSTDGVTWKDLTQVEAQGNSTTRRDYNTVDENPNIGLNYYRLIDVDFDGNKNYSHVVSANMTGVDLVSIFPNPNKGRFFLQMNVTNNSSDVEVLLHNAAGQLVKSEKQRMNTGMQEIPIDLKGEAGVYFLTVIVDGIKVYHGKRLVIQ